jgi:hypothetical protein
VQCDRHLQRKFLVCKMNNNKIPNISISAINCNSLNVSTLGTRNSKTYLKIEAITGKKTDVIMMTDVRLKNKGGGLTEINGAN